MPPEPNYTTTSYCHCRHHSWRAQPPDLDLTRVARDAFGFLTTWRELDPSNFSGLGSTHLLFICRHGWDLVFCLIRGLNWVWMDASFTPLAHTYQWIPPVIHEFNVISSFSFPFFSI
jgi:hypothetical protein